MKILLVHNYFHIVGGAETYVFNLEKLLREKGHEVHFFSMESPRNFHSEDSKYFVSYLPPSDEMKFVDKLRKLPKILYSLEARRKIKDLIKHYRPDIVHINNIWHEITHSIILEIKKFNIPIVMTLHDYRMVCPNHKLLDNNKLCFSCDNERYYMSLINNCFGDSRLKDSIAMMSHYVNNCFLKSHRLIDLFISPSKFLQGFLSKSSLLKNARIEHLPYCIDTSGYDSSFDVTDNSIVYFGRIDYEKGIDILIEAVKGIDIVLKIIGRGPKRNALKEMVAKKNIKNVQFIDFIAHDKLKEEVSKSLFSVIPSIWYENYPYSVIESFALGKPVVGSRIGGISELIIEGQTGLTFVPNNIEDLRKKITYLLNNKEVVRGMGVNAKRWVKDNLNYEYHYKVLHNLYSLVLNNY